MIIKIKLLIQIKLVDGIIVCVFFLIIVCVFFLSGQPVNEPIDVHVVFFCDTVISTTHRKQFKGLGVFHQIYNAKEFDECILCTGKVRMV